MKSVAIKESEGDVLQKNYSSYVMGIDVGGTNINIGIAGIKNEKPVILYSLNYKTKEFNSIIPVINESCEYSKNEYDIIPKVCCIGGAGVVSKSKDYIELTNVGWNISVEDILKNTSLTKVFLINDFQAIGYGINLLDHNNSNDVHVIKKAIDGNHTKGIIGAGTGLGKSILIFDEKINSYVPLASEGGHSDFPITNDLELKLSKYIKEKEGMVEPLSYEELLSGRGLENIYYFIKTKEGYSDTQYTDEINNSEDKAEAISKYKTLDPACKETFRLFTKFYARCAKNFILDTMAIGGLYIAGGIATKNKEIFESEEFFEEFKNVYKKRELLNNVPVYVIVNYDVSLYGTCFAAMLNDNK